MMTDWMGMAGSGFQLIAVCFGLVALAGIIAFSASRLSLMKRYKQFKCTVWEKDGFENLSENTDWAGIFVDKKTGNKRFFLKNGKVGLTPDEVPWVPGPKGQKIVHLYRYGLKNYAFIKPSVSLNPGVRLQVTEEDVNWAGNEYAHIKASLLANTLLQYMPFIALAFTSIIILVIFIYFFKDFGTLKDAATALQEASRNLAAYHSGTTVIPVAH